VRLIIAGEFYENSQPYFDFIQDNQLQKHIVPYYQFIANDQVRYFFSAADVLAQPYKHATQSGVTQVAYHFDLPMVVTDVGGLAELVPHNQVGYVVQPDAAAIANAIADFFDKNQKNTFAKNANVFKKQFSWAIFIDTLLR
jgi:glycosyltransferase involved in cell wall biosynthesis